ncbi:MAG TPA: hypothetical protein VKU01_03120 [Bryobacteraceae bacterium]|nr:hypothetical protein [Bryobacteraceae bacterium]
MYSPNSNLRNNVLVRFAIRDEFESFLFDDAAFRARTSKIYVNGLS